MFDIAAFLSVKPAGPGADIAPAAGMPGGMEAADIQAFGDILAGRIGGQTTGATPDASPTLAFADLPAAPPAIAGKLPEGGKILPDGLPVAPDMLPPGVATLAIPVLAPAAADPLSLAALKPMPEADILPEDAPAQPAPVAPEARRAEVLAKLLAAGQALKAALPKITAERPGEANPDVADDTDVEAAPESAMAMTATTALPALPIPAEATLVAAPIALPVPQYAQTPVATADEPAPETAAAKPAPAQPVATSVVALSAAAIPPTIAAQPAAPAPLPTIAAANPTETAAAATPIAVLPAQPAPVSESTRFRVAQAPAKAAKAAATEPASLEPTASQPTGAKPAAAVAAQPAEQPAEPARAAFVRAAISGDERERRAAPAFQPVSTLADLSQAQAQPQGAAGVAPVQAATPAQPGHDFVKLVDRLIDARDSAAPQSVVSAAIKHAEFGQVSLHFQQDASGLTVSMASADPDFQPAVQAAMPADRGGMASDQGQAGQNQQNQSGGSASFLPQDQRGAGTSGEQSRAAQERNPRAAGNPSQAARDEGEKPDRRSGIFA